MSSIVESLEMKRSNRGYLTLFSCIVFMILSHPGFGSDLDEEIKSFENLSYAYHLILRNYVDEKDGPELIRSALEGMVESLDPYSELVTAEELEILEGNSLGKYPGIGISVQLKDKGLIVAQVFKSSPAEKVGLKLGDVLVKINDESILGKTEAELLRIIHNQNGTVVKIHFFHPENPKKIIIKHIRRDWILTHSVDFYHFDPDIAVLQVHEFVKNTPIEIRRYLDDDKFRSIILDLRNNPGGLLLSAVESAEQFLSMGPIVEIRGRNNERKEKFISYRKFESEPPFLVALINRYSASAAEIVAGALKDRGAGVIIGERSFGKGLVQSILPLKNDLYIKITTARYYTPGGNSFHGVGIQPDIQVADIAGISRYDDNDAIFQRALRLIHDRKK